MLYNEIESFKKFGGSPKIPEYIIENLKFPLYEWQKTALENFLINENGRKSKIQNGEIVSPNHLMFNMATGSGKTLVMAALILYYYKEHKINNFIFFVNQNTIVGKTQDNFINKSHAKYLFRENIIIDEKRVNIREVEQFSNSTDDIQIKFTTIQKLHNDIYKENENSLLLSDLQKRNLVLIGDEAHHLNATTNKRKDSDFSDEDLSFIGELKDSAKSEDVERSWETTVCHKILNKGKKSADSQNKNVLLEFTATVPETEEVQKKYANKIIIKFDLKEFVNAGCTKHIRLVRANLEKKERILQALVLNWYRFQVALKNDVPNFKPVILFRSKTIEESKLDFQEFVELCQNVKSEDFDFLSTYENYIASDDSIPNAYSADKEIFSRIFKFIKDNNSSYSVIADYIKENFQERNCIITNSATNKTKTEKTDAEIDKLLNSLEDVHNHIRAIFTVQRLTEGWDVLNLYDIVRLFHGRDTDYKNNKLGKGTTSEIQLIGRGVRYYPFAYGEKIKNRRKFDNDLNNELRILEEFYFHSDNDERYISDLKKGLEDAKLIYSTKIEKKFAIKDEYRKTFSKMYLFCNKKVENPNRKLKTLPEDFAKLNFSYSFEAKTSHITNVNMSGENLTDTESLEGGSTLTVHISELLKSYSNIIYKALHSLNSDCNSYFSFENLRHRFNVDGMEKFLFFIEPVTLELIFRDGKKIILDKEDNFENLEEPSEILKMLKEFFLYCQRELEKYDHPFKATEFELVPFESCFSFETTRIIDANPEKDGYNDNIKFDQSCKLLKWYALDSFWGTTEERNLINFINNRISDLEFQYDEICLLRNEEVYKIFDFDTGEGFQPDFLLLLKEKNDKNVAYFQVFIESKGEHLKGEDNDAWKEKFLMKISEEYGFSKPIVEKSDKYILFGLPFFNESDSEMKNRFLENFNNLLNVKTSPTYTIPSDFAIRKIADKL